MYVPCNAPRNTQRSKKKKKKKIERKNPEIICVTPMCGYVAGKIAFFSHNRNVRWKTKMSFTFTFSLRNVKFVGGVLTTTLSR